MPVSSCSRGVRDAVYRPRYIALLNISSTRKAAQDAVYRPRYIAPLKDSSTPKLQHLSIMPVLLLSLQEEEDDEQGAAQQLLAKFKISWHLYFFQNLKKLSPGAKEGKLFSKNFFDRMIF